MQHYRRFLHENQPLQYSIILAIRGQFFKANDVVYVKDFLKFQMLIYIDNLVGKI